MSKRKPVIFSIRGKPISRVRSYVSRLTRVFIGISLIAGVMALVQAIAHPFDPVLEQANVKLAQIDRTLDSNLVSGISVGTIVIIVAIAGVAVLGRGVHRKQYVVSFWRGILSSAIFLLSDSFYRFVRDQGRLYYTASIALFIAVMLILVEIMARWGNLAEERERRTEFLASIVSGLCFALIVQAGEAFLRYGSRYLSALVGRS